MWPANNDVSILYATGFVLSTKLDYNTQELPM